MSNPSESSVLFLCTGNYYRSRFAEVLFNQIAGQRKLSWRATSRGLRLSENNVGPISAHAIEGLGNLSLSIDLDTERFPIPVTLADLEAATHVVAVKEVEHRPLLAEQFPAWVERVIFWQIDDIDCAPPTSALPLLEQHVRDLAEELFSRRAAS